MGGGGHSAFYAMLKSNFYPVVRRPQREAEHDFPSRADVKNKCSYTYIFAYAFMACKGATLTIIS